MSTINLPKVRACSDITFRVSLKDNDVAIDWTSLSDVKALIYHDAQKAVAGRCVVAVDEEDSTVLVCTYAATKPQYLGINSIVIRCKYMGREKTYDKPAVDIVARTAEATGQTQISDPEVDVDIDVEEVSTSLLDNAIAAAFDAAADAEEAAHLVPLQVLQDCVTATGQAQDATTAANAAAEAANAAGITQVEASVDANVGTPSVDVDLTNKKLTLDFHNMKGIQGETGATPAISIGTVTTGEAGSQAAATMTGTAAAPVLNLTIPKGDKGDQGNTGSSVDFPYELVNNLTTNDATKGLSAAQGKILDGKVSQLEAEVDGESVYDTDLVISVTQSTGIGTGTKHTLDAPLLKDKKYTIKLTGYSGVVSSITLYLYDENNTQVSGLWDDGATGTYKTFSSGHWTRTIVPAADIKKLAVYLTYDKATGTGDITFNVHRNAVPGLNQNVEELSQDLSELTQDVGELDTKVVDLSLTSKIDLSSLEITESVISSSTNKWVAGYGSCCFVPLNPGQKYRVVNNNATYSAHIAVLAEDEWGPDGDTPEWATGFTGDIAVASNEEYIFTAPLDAVSLYVRLLISGNDITPDIFTSINDFNSKIEQGDNDVNGDKTTVDLALYTESNHAMGSSTSSNWTSTGKHKVIPVLPGERYRLRVTSTNAAGFWSFFTSSYVAPTGTTSPIYYATGFARTNCPVSRDFEVTVPNDAAYLVITTVDGSGNKYEWHISKISDGLVQRIDKDEERLDLHDFAFGVEELDKTKLTIRTGNINATGQWASGSTGRHYFIPVVPGEKYIIEASDWYDSYYAFLTSADYTAGAAAPFVTGTTRQTIQLGETAFIEIPLGCFVLYVYSGDTSSSATSFAPKSIKKLVDIAHLNQRKAKYELTKGYIVDARPSSETFGTLISAGENTYGTSQYIDLRGVKHVRYYANITSSSNKYYNKTGTVFYDNDYQPLTEAVRLIQQSTTTGVADWVMQEVPEGAAYMRVTVSFLLNDLARVELYSLGIDDIAGLRSALWNSLKSLGYGSRNVHRQVRLLHCSDIHGDGDRWQRISTFATDNNLVALHTGDTIKYQWTATAWDFLQSSGVTNILNCIGNHDANVDGNYSAATPKEVYDKIIGPYVDGWDVVQPTGASDGKLYYYKDIAEDVRLIVLDMHNVSQNFGNISRAERVEGYTAAQLSWFEDVLADALSNGMSVVCASHYLLYGLTCDVETNWDEGREQPTWAENNTDRFGSIGYDFVDAVSDFIDNGGNFVCWLAGHVHVSQFSHASRDPRQLQICVANGSLKPFAESGHVRSSIGDFADEFNVIVIYPDDGVLFVNRIGANLTNMGTRQNCIAYDYINSELMLSN